MEPLLLRLPVGLGFLNAGYFVSRGRGRHADRVIQSHELILVERGELHMYEEERRFAVQAGQTLLLFPGRRHGGTAPYAANLRFYWLHFHPAAGVLGEASPSGVTGSARRARLSPETLRIHQHALVAEAGRLQWVFRRLLDDQEAGWSDAVTSSALLALLLAELRQPAPATEGGAALPAEGNAGPLRGGAGKSGDERLVQRIEALINLRFHMPLTAGSIARELRYNSDYLTRVYRQIRGGTLTEAIHRRRVRQARQMLLEGKLNLNEIGLECGFGDPAHFRKVFRRYEGVAPGEYRRMCARMHINTE